MLKISVVNVASWTMGAILVFLIIGIIIKKYIIGRNSNSGNGVSKKLLVFLKDLKNNNKDVEIIYNVFIKSRKKVTRIPGGALSKGQITLFTNIVNFNKDLKIGEGENIFKDNGKKFLDIDLKTLYKFRNKLINKMGIGREDIHIVVINKGKGNIIDSRLTVKDPDELLSSDLSFGSGNIDVKKVKKFIENENIVKIKNTKENIKKELKGK